MGFCLLFAGAGLLISVGICFIMYIQYNNYIKVSYFDTLERAAVLVEKQYPELHETDRLKQGAAENADWFWEIFRDLSNIAASFNLAYIYYIERTEAGYVFLLSSAISRDVHAQWLGKSVWAEDTPIPAGVDEAYDTQRMTFSPRPTVNEWGALVYVNMPVLTRGKTVGILGVAYDVSFMDALQRKALVIMLISLAVTLVFAGGLAFFGSRPAAIPVHEQQRAVQEPEERGTEIEDPPEAPKVSSASKSAFLANINHEMRTPMNAITGLSALMLNEKDISEKARKNLEIINDSGMMLRSVISDILDIHKIEAGRLEIISVQYDLPGLISGITALGAMYADKPVRFELQIDETLPLNLFGDELRIRQICRRLLSNAFKFTEAGSVVLAVSSERDGGYIWLSISVKDTGIGIRPEDAAMLFSDYGQLDAAVSRKSSGTGLSLVIAKQTAEMMDGSLTVESEPGKGSVFTLRVRQKFVSPALIGPEAVENLTRFRGLSGKRDQSQRLARIRIPHVRALVVDDMETNLKVIQGILQLYRMQVDCVSSGQEAVDRIRGAEVNYGLIFMDYMMPGMDGIEAARIIREEIGTLYAKTVPVIALTAAEVDSKEELFLQNGFNTFLLKPIDIVSLDSVINRWVRDIEVPVTAG
jgi:signal transduction histidine kinase/CheY-like chemotaxis protein